MQSATEFASLCKLVLSSPPDAASLKVRAAYPNLSQTQRQKLALTLRKQSSTPQPALLDLLTNQIPKTASMNSSGKSATIIDLASLASSSINEPEAFESAMNNLISRLDALPIYQMFDYSKDIDESLLSVYWTALDDSTLLAGPSDPIVGTGINKLITSLISRNLVPEKLRSGLLTRVLQTYYSDAPACFKSSFYSAFSAGTAAVCSKTSRQVIELILTDLQEFSLRAFNPPPKDSIYDSKSVDLTGEFTASVISSLKTLNVLLKSAPQVCIVSTLQSTISIVLAAQRLRLSKKEPHFRVKCSSAILLLLNQILYECVVGGRIAGDGCASVVAMRLFKNGTGSPDVSVARACEGFVRGLAVAVSRGGFAWVNSEKKEGEVSEGLFGEVGMGVRDPFKALVRPEAAVVKEAEAVEEEEMVEIKAESVAAVIEKLVDDAVMMPALDPVGEKREAPAVNKEEIPSPKKQKLPVLETKKEASDSEDEDVNMEISLDVDSE